MQHNQTKYHKLNLQALLYNQAVTETFYIWILWFEKLINGILYHGTFKINHC